MLGDFQKTKIFKKPILGGLFFSFCLIIPTKFSKKMILFSLNSSIKRLLKRNLGLWIGNSRNCATGKKLQIYN